MAGLLENPVATGVGGAIGGLAVGALLSLSTIDSKIGASMDGAMDSIASVVEGDDAALSEVSDRLGALEGAMSDTSGAVAALQDTVSEQTEAVSGAVSDLGARMPEDLGARMDTLESRIETAADDLERRVTQTVSAQTETLRTALEARPAPAAEAAPEPQTAAAEAPRAALPDALRETGETRGVGETFVLADGAVRAFVRRTDAQAGTALLSVNGAATPLAVGETAVVRHADGACRVGLAAVTGDGVRLGSDCGMSAGDAAPGTAYAPGHVAMLGDGQLRIFVSGIFGDEARLAINGVQTVRVRVGETHEVAVGAGSCSVSVTGIRGNSVLLTGACA